MMTHVMSALYLTLLLPTAVPMIIFPGPSGTSQDRCQLPSDGGMCRAYWEMFFHNPATGRCEMFVYGGCGGNANRFDTREDCEDACVASQESSNDVASQESSSEVSSQESSNDVAPQEYSRYVNWVCSLPPATGLCRASFPAYFYNARTGRCEFFIYGGCGGNANRFNTLVQCEQICS